MTPRTRGLLLKTLIFLSSLIRDPGTGRIDLQPFNLLPWLLLKPFTEGSYFFILLNSFLRIWNKPSKSACGTGTLVPQHLDLQSFVLNPNTRAIAEGSEIVDRPPKKDLFGWLTVWPFRRANFFCLWGPVYTVPDPHGHDIEFGQFVDIFILTFILTTDFLYY